MMSRDEVINELTRVDTQIDGRTVFVHGYLDSVHVHFYDVTIVNDRFSKQVRLMPAFARFVRTSADTALIEIPVAVVTTFSLQPYVLCDAEVAKFRRWAEEHNAPYLQHSPAYKPERIGDVRI